MRSDKRLRIDIRHVIGHQMTEFFEPEIRHSSQNTALVRNRVFHNDVESGQTIGLDNKEFIVTDSVNIPDFSAMQKRQGFDLRFH